MFVRTPRLFLRPGWIEDAVPLASALADPAIARMLMQVPHPYGVEDAIAFLRQGHKPDEPQFLVHLRTSGAPRLVGGAGLCRTEEGRLDLGYWIARPYWGLGYATEAARAVLDVAFGSLRLPAVEARHFVDNPASARVLRKLGFQSQGEIAPCHSRARDKPAPARRLRLKASDWRVAAMPEPAMAA